MGKEWFVNHYEYKKTTKSANHRTHRTKRTKGGYKRRIERIGYNKKLEKIKSKDLDQMEKLTKKQKGFVKDYIETDNATESADRNYDVKNRNVANAIGAENLAKPSIKNAIKTVADSIPDKKLIEVHLEGLEAGKRVFKNNNETGEIEDMGVEADYAVRHKYLDSAYKIKGFYPKEGSQTNVQININRFKDYE